VSKKIAADMFGLALRSYQLKVQRLQESASETGVTLWSAVKAFIDQRGAVNRSEVLARFARDDEANVRGVLADLVESGLCSRTGRADASIYRTTPQSDLSSLAQADSREAQSALVWLLVCRDGPLSREAIANGTGLAPAAVDQALAELCADSRVQSQETEHGELLSAERCLIPIGSAAGWEAAILDHHQAVLNAIAAKVSAGTHSSSAEDETGGTTLSFELWPGHPEELAVRGLLAELRARATGLWERVSAHNAQAKHGESGRYNVAFYIGQHVRREDHEEH
jgi:hypothetical protein